MSAAVPGQGAAALAPDAPDAPAWCWVAREPPLAPLAVVGRGPVARRLAARLLRREEAALAALSGVAGEDVLLLLGDAAALPWEDGVEYLGRDATAPLLLLPTRRAPSVPAALLAQALLRPSPAGQSPLRVPLAVLPDGLLVSAHAARPVSRARLAAWLDASGGTGP